MKISKAKPLVRGILAFAYTSMHQHLAACGLILGALPLTVDALDTVPEAHRALYVEKDGKFHLDITGLEDTTNLKSALEKERKAARDADQARKDFERRFVGIDPDKHKALMSKFESQEEADLIAAGKMDEVIAKRTEKRNAEADRLVKEAQTNTEKALERAKQYSQRVLDNHIRAAVSGLTHKGAIDDALLFARQIFTLDDNGDAVQLDKDGEVVLGKDGKTPFTPAEWIESMKESKPHWFPAGNTGGGSGGDKGGRGGRDLSKLSPTEKLTAARAGTKK
ncbi:MAG: hypothetical protein A3I66_01380 [Burkholderiales bacterium RIFCSPLOWO2_02_FULL_57_36]|nr:MAG: hypothetical protein A3I66_01380 [Burkholderiales bacterium RIFCSPLOWO2_02_FULL_57_36]